MSTTPQAEYCLFFINAWFTCMTKSEWASWTQTIGVFVAAFLALVFPLAGIVEKRREINQQIANDRLALNDLRQDVIHFVGPMVSYCKELRPINIDEIQFEKILQRISYFDTRVQGDWERRLLQLMRSTLREVKRYQVKVEEPRFKKEVIQLTEAAAIIQRRYPQLTNTQFNADLEPYFLVKDDKFANEEFQPSTKRSAVAKLVSIFRY